MLGTAADRRFLLALLIAAIVTAPRPAGLESAIHLEQPKAAVVSMGGQ
jgi:hypothetical protein